MIRLFTIFCKLDHISFSDRQWFELETASLYITTQECPYCHAKGCISSFSHYNRFLIETGRHGLVEHTISVPRMLCHSCGHTHAVLSSCLIPYRSYSLRSILTLLRYYFLQQYTVQQLCEAYGIAVSTLYAWKQLFFHQKAVWLGVLTDLSLTSLTFLDQLDGLLLIEFFRKFAISFLQQMNGTDRALLFAHGTAPPVIT